MYRYGELSFSVWPHKLRFLAKLLQSPKRAKNTSYFNSITLTLVVSYPEKFRILYAVLWIRITLMRIRIRIRIRLIIILMRIRILIFYFMRMRIRTQIHPDTDPDLDPSFQINAQNF
jgi:hypothetical protein